MIVCLKEFYMKQTKWKGKCPSTNNTRERKGKTLTKNWRDHHRKGTCKHTNSSDAIFVMCSHTFILFWLRKTSVTVKLFWLSFRVFASAFPTVISSIFGKSFPFPFPNFVLNHNISIHYIKIQIITAFATYIFYNYLSCKLYLACQKAHCIASLSECENQSKVTKLLYCHRFLIGMYIFKSIRLLEVDENYVKWFHYIQVKLI